MKKTLSRLVYTSVLSAFAASAVYAANPASKEWVLQQLAANGPVLTTSDWNAVCSTGSPSSQAGCYGNASSAAFAKLSKYTGGFLRYANIKPANVSSSIFVKAFFAGTNTPAQLHNLVVTATNNAARCALFTQAGQGLGLGGISTTNPTSGNTSSEFVVLHAVSFVTLNNISTSVIYYNNESIGGGSSAPLSAVNIPKPIYLLCAGFSTTDGSTAAPLNISAT